jgi:putative transposase
MEAYLQGTSTRKVDDLVKALGADSGISKNEVSRICADLDTEVAAFRDRPLSQQRFPYVFLDTTYCKARVNHPVCPKPWSSPPGRQPTDAVKSRLSSLRYRGRCVLDGVFCGRSRLAGVALVISDAHAGLRGAIEAILLGATCTTERWHAYTVLKPSPCR